jgi:hypothetical protein
MNKTMFPNVLSSTTICTDHVKNAAGEDLGKIEDLMSSFPQTVLEDSLDTVLWSSWPPRQVAASGTIRAVLRVQESGTCPHNSLRALWQQAPYLHDGSVATLSDVVAHYNRVRTLGFTADQQRDLVEYLKSRWTNSTEAWW